MVFYLGWAQGFPHKNSCLLYFPHYLPTIESRSVSKISLTNCSRKLGKNTIHPPLVSCALKSTGLFPKLLMRLWTCLTGWLGIFMSLKILRMLVGCLFLIHVRFMLDQFMRKKLMNFYACPSFIIECVAPKCDLCCVFYHNFDSCPYYIQLKVEIKNSMKIAFNSTEHMTSEKIS